MEPIEIMTEQQANEKYGERTLDRTTSQRCPHCANMIYCDDFIDEDEPETLDCPTCKVTVSNKFYPKSPRYTAKQVQYMKLRYHANEKLLEALKAIENLNEQMFLGKVVAIGDHDKAVKKVQAECVGLRKLFSQSGI